MSSAELSSHHIHPKDYKNLTYTVRLTKLALPTLSRTAAIASGSYLLL